MIKKFNNLEEIQKYYDEKTNTYVFKEDGSYIDSIIFNFDLDVKANIDALDINATDIDANNIDARDINALNIETMDINAWDIKAWNINASNINASNIDATDIKANNISYFAVCFAYNNIKCKSIKGRRSNAKHFVLDGTLEVEDDKQD